MSVTNSLTYKMLRYILAKERAKFLVVLGMSLAGAFVELLGVTTIYPFLALLNNPDLVHSQPLLRWLYASLEYTNERQFIFHVGVTAIGCFAFANCFIFFKTSLIINYSYSKMTQLSVSLLRHYLLKPYSYFFNVNSGELSNHILMQSDTVANRFLFPWLTSISESFVLVALISLIVYVDLKSGLFIFLGLGGIVFGIHCVLRQRISIMGRKSDEENSRRIAYCLEALGAIKEIKSAQKEDFFCKEFSLPAQNLARAYARVNVLQLIPSYFVQAITAIFIIGLALFQMHSGSPLTNIVPILAFYVVGGYRLMPSLLRFSGAISQLRQNKAVFDNVVSILAGSAEEIKRKPAGEVQPVSVNRQIQLKDIVYTYPGARRPVLDHLELTINKDSFVAIVGGSGVGKTTLVDILLGLLPVDSGTIQIDDRPLTEGAFSEWRRIIGYIPQSVFLLNTTIGSNIAFGIPEEEINWAKVKEAANMSHLDEFINQLPEGLYTHVGERGIKLSGGQLQRIGIARALYTDPQVLILDESTSALDGITEQGIVETLKELKNEKIVIVIAHRHSTVRNAEVIVLLEKGKVSDLGPYDDLIARNAHFRKLMSQWQSPLSMPSLSAAGMTHHLA